MNTKVDTSIALLIMSKAAAWLATEKPASRVSDSGPEGRCRRYPAARLLTILPPKTRRLDVRSGVAVDKPAQSLTAKIVAAVDGSQVWSQSYPVANADPLRSRRR